MSTVSRREFLTRGWGAKAGASEEARNLRWVRPPFARPEVDFLRLCTKCTDCADACSHDVIFRLSASVGDMAQGTPALDLLNRGCHLCDGFPCVGACETGALGFPETDSAPLPRPNLATCEVSAEACFAYDGPECGACADSCPVPGALTWLDATKPRINPALCIGCALCREACIVSPKAISVKPGV
ncbi:MAG: hypothetical protein ACE5DK_07920 [Paracoccaceae bacterium]